MTQTFILSSDEPLLKNDRAGELLAQARGRMPQAEFMLFTAAELRTRGLGVLENELADPGLFRRERIIRIYVEPPAARRSYDFEAPGLDILNLCVATPGSGAVVILDLPRISYAYSRVPARTLSDEERRSFPREQKRRSPAAQKKEALAAICGLGGSLEFFYAPEGRELGQFARRRAAACGLQLDAGALEYLCACGEGNLSVIDQALRQLQAALPPGAGSGDGPLQAVTAAQLQALCEPDSRCAAEDFAVALFMGHDARALQVLSSLQQPGGAAAAESLAQIVSRLNGCLSLIARSRTLPAGSGPGGERFFTDQGVRLRTTREALVMAARYLSDEHLLLLSQLTAAAASALSGFAFAQCRCLLQDMALCLTRPQARALHAPQRGRA